MAEPTRERRGHFRGKPRPGRRVEVRYRLVENGVPQAETSAYTKNIGVGGAFILAAVPLQPGSLLQITVHMPQAPQPIEVEAEVRWIIAGEGMGVKFLGLDVEQLLALNDYFATITLTLDHDDV